MSCEKASKRLRCIITKARRLGLTEWELADLSGVKRITSSSTSPSTWSLVAVMIGLIIGGTLVLATICNPCVSGKHIHHAHRGQ